MNPTPETNLDLITLVRSNNHEQRLSAVNELVETYRPFVFAVIASRSESRNDIDDLSQEFIRKKLISSHLFNAWSANPTGRFRHYLRRSIHNFCNDVWKVEKKIPDTVAIDFANESCQPSQSILDEDTVWIRTIFAQAIALMKEECEAKEQLEIWHLFFDHVLTPLFLNADNGKTTCPHPNDQKTKNRLVTAGRKFHRLFRTQLLKAGGFAEELKADEIQLLLRRACADIELVSYLASRQFFDDDISRIFLSGTATPSEVHLAAIKPVDSKDQKRWIRLLNIEASSESIDVQTDLNQHLVEPTLTKVTIGDVLFGDSEAPLELIHALRKRARDLATNDEQPFKGIYYVLYTHLICRLIDGWDVRATRLNSIQLVHNIHQCLSLDWLDEESHALLNDALRVLSKEE